MITVFLISAALYLIFCLGLITASINNMIKDQGTFRNPVIRYAFLFSEILFMIIAPIIGFYRFDDYGAETPFSESHVLIIILLTISSSAAFWTARLSREHLNPAIRIVISSLMFLGMLFCFITLIHFIPFIPLGFIYPVLGFELLTPVIAFFFLLREFWFYNKLSLDLETLLPYRAELGFVPLSYRVWQLPLAKRALVYAALLLPLIVLHVLFAYGCGQEIDALVKAYTHSHGFVFSTH